MAYIKHEISSNGIRLKIINKSDNASLHALRTNAEVSKYIIRDLNKSMSDMEKFIEDRLADDTILFYKIETLPHVEFVGTICLKNIDRTHKYAEVGYELFPQFKQKGLMTLALNALIGFAFTDLDLNVIEAYTSKQNNQSRKLLYKLGFEIVDGKQDKSYSDSVVYRLSRT